MSAIALIDVVLSQSLTIWDVGVHPAREFSANQTFGAVENQLLESCCEEIK